MTAGVLRQLLRAVDDSLPVQVYVDRPAPAGDDRVEGYFEIGALTLERGWSPQEIYPCLTVALGREL